ncbi:MAG: hypothetical protein AAF391_10385, partial [Bacteroidota bacterium]
MKKSLIISLACLLLACSNEEEKVVGKWYTYAESGDYMELWMGEDKALSYLSSIDKFLLYDLSREGNSMRFSLIESAITNSHKFELQVTNKSDELLQTIFIGQGRIDSLKTYFIVSKEVPDI